MILPSKNPVLDLITVHPLFILLLDRLLQDVVGKSSSPAMSSC